MTTYPPGDPWHAGQAGPTPYPLAAARPAEPPRSLIEVVLARKWTVLFCVALALGAGAVYQRYMPPKYESRAEIVVLRANPDAPGSPLSSAGLSTGAPTTHAAMLTSTPVLEQALDDPRIAGASFLADVNDPLRYLRKAMRVSASDDKETVSVRFEAGDADEAAALVSAVVHAYFAHQGLPVRGMTEVDGGDRPTSSVMDEQVIAARLLFLSEQEAAAKIEADLWASRYERAVAAGHDVGRLQQLLREAGGDTETIDTFQLATMSAELSRLEQQLRAMPPDWGPEHRLRAPTQQQYEVMVERYAAARAALARQMLTVLRESHDQATDQHARLADELAALHADADHARLSPVRVIDPPRVATKKSSPIALQTYGIAGFIGLVLGGCFAVRSEMRRPTVAATPQAPIDEPWQPASFPAPKLLQSREDLERAEPTRDVPLLGMVPEQPTGRRLTTPNFASTASSIHQVRAVLQVRASKQGTGSYAFTSPKRGAGKTSVTIGVASSLAVSGTRTLVVDCDLAGRIVRGQTGRPASPALVEPFGPIDRAGSSPHNESLDDIAVGQGYLPTDNTGTPLPQHTPPSQSVGVVGMLEGRPLDDCAVKATVDGLYLLPAAGAETRHIGQMSDRFIRDLLDQARGKFDLVLFDTGPVPGSVEALLVTSQVDGVVVVVPQGESGKALDRTMSYLKVVEAEVIGTVFNHAKARRPGPDAGAPAAANGTPTPDSHEPGAGDLLDLDAHQNDVARDIDDALDDVPLGSGILAAAVFADEASGFASDDWELRETSEFDQAEGGDRSGQDSQAEVRKRRQQDAINDILPPE